VFKQFDRATVQGQQVGYSEFLQEVRDKNIKSVTIQDGMGSIDITAITTDGNKIRTTGTCWTAA
jgi:cell division protease FtsH